MLTDLPTTTDRDRRAVYASFDALTTWSPGSSDPETPCGDWRLSDLVAHVTVQQRGFARAARGERTDITDWAPTKHGDPIAAYHEACDDVVAAFAELEDPDAPVYLPEISADALPAGMILGFHLVDNVVHAWDIARALGRDAEFDDDVVLAALDVARQVPDDDRRGKPGSPFARRLPLPVGAAPLDETLLLLGRDPHWQPSTG